MDSIGFAREFAWPKEPVDPPEIIANGSLPFYRFLYPAASLARCDVVNKTISAEVDTVLPQAAFQLGAFETEHHSFGRYLNRFPSSRILGHGFNFYMNQNDSATAIALPL